MEESATANAVTVPNKRSRNQSRWIYLYTNTIGMIGLLISAYALSHLPEDKAGLVTFIVMAFIVEFASVELFKSSRSWVSMSSVIAIAGIIVLGPWAGVITYLASGVATGLTTSVRKSQNKEERVPLFHRMTFNAGMWTIAAATAGTVYLLVGGKTGSLPQISILPALVLATLVEWLVNAVILIGVISIQTGQKPSAIWNRDIRWQAPVSIVGGVLGGGFLALAYGMFGMFGLLIVLLPILSTSYAFNAYKTNMRVYVEGLESLNKDLKNALSALETSNFDLIEANQVVQRLNAELFQSLAKVFDMRDPYVGGHAAQVANYAVAIAMEMGLPAERIEVIRQSAFLHDIGKLAIPEAILHKPGKLTEIEYQFIKKHTDIGADLLASTEGLKHLAPFVRHHHERWDGRGYPMGLAGKEIPLEARILNVCDSVESMASDRPYHRGMSIGEIKVEVEHCRGAQFDPEVVDIFVELIQRKGRDFVINSARSVTQQYAASILANESLTQSMFAWVLENEAQKQLVEVKSPLPASADK
jgi:putative nucleotidyltransferase with HDIG domain